MHFFVYILWSSGLQKFYIGQTQYLESRLKEHNAGEGNFSAKGKPSWVLFYQIECTSRKDAVFLEKKIKNRGARRYLANINFSFSLG